MFRFTIRDVLWLMVVVGLACWCYRERAAIRSQAVKLASDSDAVQMERARLDSERSDLMKTVNGIQANAFQAGYGRGVKHGAAQGRVIFVPASQQEAEAGACLVGAVAQAASQGG